MLRAAERVSSLEKLLNIREGFTQADDRFPPLYLQNTVRPLKAIKGDRYLSDWFGKRLTRADLKKMLEDFYEERGWDIQKGEPTKKKLMELGLEDFVGIMKS